MNAIFRRFAKGAAIRFVIPLHIAFWAFNSSAIEIREELGHIGGNYIYPNETHNDAYDEVFKNQTGALISVGTFRTLTEAGIGNFARIYMLDLDESVSAFNRINLALIKESGGNRMKWLSRLFVGNDWYENQTEANGGHEISELEIYTRIIRNNASVETGWWLRMVREWAEILKSRPDLQKEFEILTKAQVGKQFFTDRVPFDLIYAAYSKEKKWERSIFGSDQIFSKVYSDAIANKFFVVTGSLSGSNSMVDITEDLEQSQMKVSAVDLSNAIIFIMPGTVHQDSAATPRFLQNLKRLPWAANGVILSTMELFRLKKGIKDLLLWNHYWQSYFDFLAGEKLGVFKNLESYIRNMQVGSRIPGANEINDPYLFPAFKFSEQHSYFQSVFSRCLRVLSPKSN